MASYGQDFGTYLANLGGGASMGLTKYPAALALRATRALTGGAPLTWEEAVAEAAAQQRLANEASPTAATLGDLSGNVINAALVGGAGIPQLVARGAATGAVRGFTENEGLDGALADTATGAGLGAALGGLAGGADKALRAVTKSQLLKQAEGTRKAYQAERDALILHRDQLKQVKPTSTTEYRQLQQSLADANKRIGGLQGNIAKLDKSTSAMRPSTAEADEVARDVSSLKFIKDAPGWFRPSPLTSTRNVLPGGAVGAVTGLTGAVLTGQDPVKGALLGATAGGGLAAIGPRAALSAVNTGAKAAGKVGGSPGTLAQLAGSAAIPAVVRQPEVMTTSPDDAYYEDLFRRGSPQVEPAPSADAELEALFKRGSKTKD